MSFGDFVIKDSMASKSRIPDDTPSDFRRGWLVWLVVACGLGLILVRLVSLQIINGGKYRVFADENRVRRIKLIAPRGRILDRMGRELATDIKLDKGEKQKGLAFRFWRRDYPGGAAAAHILGYLGEVTEDEVGLLKDLGQKYDVGEIIGRGGIESQYETILRGQDGGELVEVDNQGLLVRRLGVSQPVSGADLKLTLDSQLQQEAYEDLKADEKRGAVVVSIPKTGEILSLVSSPSYDPNKLSEQYSQLVTQSNLPLFNRAIGGAYPPGSTFKMVTTIAAIESGKVDPGFRYEDPGIVTVGTYTYRNWFGGKEGVIGFSRAITRSTDTFFYEVGGKTGPDTIADWARRFGFGEKTGIDLAGEVKGLIPDSLWKQEVKEESWFLGDTYIMAIGQGDILATPLQVNLMTNILATGGKKCKPHVAQIRNSKFEASNNDGCTNVEISDETLEIIKKGMVGACSSGGTSFVFFDWNDVAITGGSKSGYAQQRDGNPLPVVACKTGTAEYVDEGGKTKTHGWLTAFAPADNPEISVTVVVEGGGEGSSVAAPIVRKVMAKYFGIDDTYPYGAIRQEIGE